MQGVDEGFPEARRHPHPVAKCVVDAAHGKEHGTGHADGPDGGRDEGVHRRRARGPSAWRAGCLVDDGYDACRVDTDPEDVVHDADE